MDTFTFRNNIYTYKQGYIVLSADLEVSPETITLHGNELQAKTAFHTSLVCVKDLVARYGPEIEGKVLAAFQDFAKQHPVQLSKITDNFRFAERDSDGRKTLIVMVEISNLEALFDHLREMLGVELLTQPTHITLFTLGSNAGIGLNTPEILEELSTPVQRSEGLVIKTKD